jgi:hypothetical protein
MFSDKYDDDQQLQLNAALGMLLAERWGEQFAKNALIDVFSEQNQSAIGLYKAAKLAGCPREVGATPNEVEIRISIHLLNPASMAEAIEDIHASINSLMRSKRFPVRKHEVLIDKSDITQSLTCISRPADGDDRKWGPCSPKLATAILNALGHVV